MLRQLPELEEVGQGHHWILCEMELGGLGDEVDGGGATLAMGLVRRTRESDCAELDTGIEEKRRLVLGDLGQVCELCCRHLLHVDLSGGGFISNLTIRR